MDSNYANMKRQKSKVSVLLLYGFVCCISAQSGPSVDWQFDPYSTDQWFKQKLDHYDSRSIQSWPQRYVTSYQFYRLGGPVFLYLSGPGPELTATDIETGAIAEYAEQQGAFVIGLEHRFYGKSRPTSDLATENLQFLTIPQTIEDIASFIRSWRSRDEFRNSKWVLFGVSYLGSLAAWFAQKHPELIDAFVASSAPLELRYEIPEFLENVGASLNETNPKCYDTVAEGFSCLSKIFNEEECHGYTLADLKDKFNFCADLDRGRPLDATGVFAELFSTINGVVMYHDPSPDSFPDTNLDRFCKYLASDKGGKPAIDKIGDKVKEINKHRGVPCAEFRFQTTVDFLRAKEWDSDAAKEGYRQLQWQLCNELGWTVASANISQPFGNYLTPFLHSEICQNLFGLTETEMRLKVLKANTDLKGKQLNTKCGIFVNGNKDPWHTFSITKAKEAGSCNRAILIEGGSHGRDIEDFNNKPSHPPEVRQSQLKIAEYLDLWLKTGNCCEDGPGAESQRVISSLSRPTRTASDPYFAFSSLIKQPNVNVRPHAYPVDTPDKLLASPTTIPYQVSTTDVLSVSPRIPVDGESAVSVGTLRAGKAEMNIYRDPRNAELRRYRVVKLLRHRPSFIPTTPEPSMAPSMEQFEADFPEQSIRVEGRVERVFKNGTAIPTVPPSSEVNEQISLFDKDRRAIEDGVTSPNQVKESENTTSMQKGGMPGWNRKPHFRYVIKQVFKDVVGVQNTNETKNKHQSEDEEASLESIENDNSSDEESRKEISNSPKKAAKREQSLEDNVYHSLIPDGENEANRKESDGDDSNENVTSSEDKTESIQSSIQKQSREASKEDTFSQTKHVNGSEESGSESNEQESILPTHSGKKDDVSEEMVMKSTQKPKSKQHKEQEIKVDDESDEDDYEDDYDDDSDYYDDDDDEDYEKERDNVSKKGKADEASEDGEKPKNNKTNKPTVKPKARTEPTKDSIPSSEFDSGESGKPRGLREKISEKIMSSSEDIEGDEKSGEKASKINGRRHKGHQSDNDGNESSDEAESTENRQTSSRSKPDTFSEEDYDYSLEPSGSDPKGVYKKKKMSSTNKPILEDPSTVIHVEISGSYPNRKSPTARKSKQARYSQISDTVNSTETQEESIKPKRIKKTKSKRIKVEVNEKLEHDQKNTTTTTTTLRRKKVKKPKQSTTSTTSTTTTTSTSTTTVAPETTTIPIVAIPELPPTNNYARWNANHERSRGHAEAMQIQQEDPNVVSLNSANPDSMYLPPPPLAQPSTPPANSNNDVIYIIIGDIPAANNPNLINENPSHEDLFNFIQKLVNRHSPSVSAQHTYSPNVVEYNPPTPPTAQPTTTTTTPTPPPPPLPFNQHRYLDASGKYLLLPVQVVPLPTVDAQKTTTATPVHSYQHQTPIRHDYRRQNIDPVGGYRFKSPLHRDHFEKLLSVDAQVRDSDRGTTSGRHSVRRLDEIPDQSWRSIRGVSQFGPVPSPNNGGASNLLSLTLADTMWVNEGVPFLPRNRISKRNA